MVDVRIFQWDNWRHGLEARIDRLAFKGPAHRMRTHELNALDAADQSVLLCKASRMANERNRRSDLATSVERMLPATLISSTNS